MTDKSHVNNNSVNTYQIDDSLESSNTITFIKEKPRTILGTMDDTSRVHIDLTLARHIEERSEIQTPQAVAEPTQQSMAEIDKTNAEGHQNATDPDISLAKFQDELTDGLKYIYDPKKQLD